MQRIIQTAVTLSRRYSRSNSRCFLSQVAHTQNSIQDNNDILTRKMPHFDYTPPPYSGPSSAEILKKRKEYLSPSLFHFYNNPVCFLCTNLIHFTIFFSLIQMHRNRCKYNFLQYQKIIIFQMHRNRRIYNFLQYQKIIRYHRSNVILSLSSNVGFCREFNETRTLTFLDGILSPLTLDFVVSEFNQQFLLFMKQEESHVVGCDIFTLTLDFVVNLISEIYYYVNRTSLSSLLEFRRYWNVYDVWW